MPYVDSGVPVSGSITLRAAWDALQPLPIITVGSAAQVASSTNANMVVLQALDNGYALCVFGGDTAVVEVTPSAVTTVTTSSTGYTQYSSDHCAAALGGGVLLGFGTAANANAYGYGAVGYLVEESSTKINGLTKEKCTSAVAGDVWILN